MTDNQLMFQEQAGRFATTREDVDARVAVIRRTGIEVVMGLIDDGYPGAAYAALMRSYLAQVYAYPALRHAHLTGGHHLDQHGGGPS